MTNFKNQKKKKKRKFSIKVLLYPKRLKMMMRRKLFNKSSLDKIIRCKIKIIAIKKQITKIVMINHIKIKKT